MRFVLAPAAFAAAVAFAASPAMAYDYNGLYAGIQAGYGFGDTEQAFGAIGGPYAVSPTEEAEFDGFVGGAHLGFNLPLGTMWLIGLEGDLEFSDQHGTDNDNGGHTNGFNANWQGSLRARLGVLLSPATLLYATAGATKLHGDFTKEDAPEDSDEASLSGWTGGGGLETELSPNVSGRIEYRYSDYGSDEGEIATYGVQVSPTSQEVRVGVSFDF